MKNVLFYDTGKGGISVLLKALALMPYLNYVYFEDTKNLPYGNKTEAEICGFVKKNLDVLIKRFEIDIIVLACNTATSCCVDFLRKQYMQVIIGIEPNVKGALKRYSNVCVFATKRTTSEPRFTRLIAQNYKKNCRLKVYSPQSLASVVESYASCKISKAQLLQCLSNLAGEVSGYDCVVLGCTHYSLVKSEIKKVFKINAIDGNWGVVKRLYHFVKYAPTAKRGSVKFLSSICSADLKEAE